MTNLLFTPNDPNRWGLPPNAGAVGASKTAALLHLDKLPPRSQAQHLFRTLGPPSSVRDALTHRASMRTHMLLRWALLWPESHELPQELSQLDSNEARAVLDDAREWADSRRALLQSRAG